MKLIDESNCFIINDFFEVNTIAGFSKPIFSGDVEKDIPQILESFLGNPQIAFLKQIHSSKIHHIDKIGNYVGDGLVTQKNNLICVVRTADCMPVFLYSNELKTIGILHMGWRGAKEGILNNIKHNLSSFKALAGIGMRKCCYEVGSEFLRHLEFKDYIKESNKKLYFDPVNFLKNKLINLGLKEENFLDLGICSFCSKQNFFSFRRDKTDNRTLSFIVRIG